MCKQNLECNFEEFDVDEHYRRHQETQVIQHDGKKRGGPYQPYPWDADSTIAHSFLIQHDDDGIARRERHSSRNGLNPKENRNVYGILKL